MYNASKTIARTIESLLSQTYKQWTAIIVNDKSSDNSLEIVRDFNDPRLISIDLKENIGAAEARNIGLSKATDGDIVMFLDSDDYWYPKKIENQVELHKKGHDFVISGYTYFYGSDSKIVLFDREYLSLNDFYKKKYRVCFSSVSFKNPCNIRFESVGHEDFIFITELMKLYGGAYVNNTNDVVYTVNSGSLSSNKLKSASWHFNILRNKFGLGSFYTFYYMACYIKEAILFKLTR